MLRIEIKKLNDNKFRVTFHVKGKLSMKREVSTRDSLQITEQLEVMLKCNPEVTQYITK